MRHGFIFVALSVCCMTFSITNASKPVVPKPILQLPKDPEHVAHYPIPLLPTPKAFQLSDLTKPQTRPLRHKDDKVGWIHLPNIEHQYMQLAQGVTEKVNGIVVHQTHVPTLAATWEVWDRHPLQDKVGTHFVISFEGKIYQTTGLRNFTHHIGKIRRRCHSADPCSCWEAGNREIATKVNEEEKVKPYPQRNLRNIDSIGIEVVRAADPIVGGKGDNAFSYRKNFHAQNYALTWLVKSLQLTFQEPGKPPLEVARHPCIGWGKQRREAESCHWNWTFKDIEPRYRPTNRPLFGIAPKLPASPLRAQQAKQRPTSSKSLQ